MTQFAALVCLQLLTAAQEPPPPSAEDFMKAVNRPVVVTHKDMKSVRVRKNLAFSEARPKLAFDLYSPPKVKGAAPVVVLLHGAMPFDIPGGPKEWGSYQSWGRLLAAHGFATVVANHSLVRAQPSFPEAAEDVDALLAYLRGHAKDLRVDPERIGIIAFSAGGPLLSRFLREPSPGVRALAGFYPLLALKAGDPIAAWAAPAKLEQLSPAQQLGSPKRPALPVFVARAGKDAVPGLNETITAFITASLAHNVPLELFNHPDGVHGFDLEQSLRSKDAIEAAIAFLRRELMR